MQSRNAIAVAAMILMGACLALIIYAGQRVYGTIGPSRAFASADGSLYLLSHGHIHVFGPDGHRRQSIDLEALGVHPRPSDFEVHRDGRLVTTDPNDSMLNRCVAPSGPCERLDLSLKTGIAQDVRQLNAAKIHIDEAGQRYYVSDNSGHSVVIADFRGKVLGRSAPGTFRYPNQLAVRQPGTLSVVDTNHYRVVTFDVQGDRFGAKLGELWAGGPALALQRSPRITRALRFFPFDSVVLPNGETWVLIAANGMRDADLVVFNRDGKPLRRIDLGDDSDPFDIEVWKDRVIISDATNYRVDAVDFSGKPVAAFDDPAFAAELGEARESPRRWKMIRVAAQVTLILVPFGALILAYRRRKPAP